MEAGTNAGLPVRSELDQDWVGAIVVGDAARNVGTVREMVVNGSARLVLRGTWASGAAFEVPAARLTRLDMHLVERLYRDRDRLCVELRELRQKLRDNGDGLAGRVKSASNG